jgi:hypothetical protein
MIKNFFKEKKKVLDRIVVSRTCEEYGGGRKKRKGDECRGTVV